jgi:hypothetical protein
VCCGYILLKISKSKVFIKLIDEQFQTLLPASSPEMIVLKPAPQLLNDDYIDETTASSVKKCKMIV